MLFELSQNRSPVVQSVDWEWHSPMAKATGQVHGGPMKCSLYVLMIQGAIETWIMKLWFIHNCIGMICFHLNNNVSYKSTT